MLNMPELPEVETVVRGLRETVAGREIAGVTLLRTDLLRPDPARFAAALPGQTIRNIRRRGKYILMGLSEHQTLLTHLKMTGQWLYLPASDPIRAHTHVLLDFIGDSFQLRYRDVRRFGYLLLGPTAELENQPPLAELGPEPLDLPFADFQARLRTRRGRIKAVLLDQRVLAGLGNIYADEALFAARIHPAQPAHTLSPRQLRRLHEAIQSILGAAIERGGSSIDGEYVAVNGESGRYQHQHQVYGRQNTPCPRCQTTLQRMVIAGRGTHLCPRCQRQW